MKTYQVYLYRSPNCIRGWLAYLLHQGPPSQEELVTVEIEASDGAKAKNAAITAANRGFAGVKVIRIDPPTE